MHFVREMCLAASGFISFHTKILDMADKTLYNIFSLKNEVEI